LGAEDGGGIDIRLTGELAHKGGILEANTLSDGRAGGVKLEVGKVTVTEGGQIRSASGVIDSETGEALVGAGAAGDVVVHARESVTISGESSAGFGSGLVTTTEGDGRAGTIQIEAGEVTLTAGGYLFSGSGSLNPVTGELGGGTGAGGDVVVHARESVTISGEDSAGFPSGLSTSTVGEGRAGTIQIETGELIVTAGGQIFSGSGGYNPLTGEDVAGKGQGGNIAVQARHVELDTDGTITARSVGPGDAGTITIQASDTFRSRNGLVTTAATQAGGGRIELSAGQTVELVDSQVRLSKAEPVMLAISLSVPALWFSTTARSLPGQSKAMAGTFLSMPTCFLPPLPAWWMLPRS
jgi:hypothetical protein